jgi:hypothetical protein
MLLATLLLSFVKPLLPCTAVPLHHDDDPSMIARCYSSVEVLYHHSKQNAHLLHVLGTIHKESFKMMTEKGRPLT